MARKTFVSLFVFFISCSALAQPAEKNWTILVYMAADNDLDIFADRNIKQMMKVGASKNFNLVLCVNTCEKKYKIKTTKIISIEKNNARILKKTTQPRLTDSGNEQTLIDFCKYAITMFPAEKYALIFWDHGTGAIDPFMRRNIRTSDLFLFDQNESSQFSPDYLSSINITEQEKPQYKAFCFDDSTGNFFTEKKVTKALTKICSECLDNKKFDLIGFDACLMAMIETASFIKEFGNFMVASQEVELGAGWDYKKVLTPFLFKDLSPEEFGRHIVDTYAQTYNFIDDYTLSCIDLQKLEPLEENIKQIAHLLHTFCKQKSNTFIFDAIKTSRFRHTCTHFDEPDFIDLVHFYQNLLHNLQKRAHCNTKKATHLNTDLERLLQQGIEFAQQTVVANKTGPYFSDASGISIYFPEYSIHRSYKSNSFATNLLWLPFLKTYFS